jgi:phosphatidylinositol glycan class K
VIVSSSRYWFNYRHVINALSIYRLVKANGIPDGNIVLMLADEYAVNPRNPLPNQLLPAGTNGPTLFDEDVEIDYRGDDVRVESFVGALTGRRRRPHRDRSGSEVDQPPQPVLDTDQDSNILIYLTGHGGDSFFKFQDAEEVLASQLASALSFMHERGLYRNVLLLADTCQAFTLGDAVAAPNVTVVGSSLRGESSYAHHSDDVLGLSVIERYTHALMEFLRGRSLDELTLRQGLVDPYSYASQGAHIGANDNTSVLKMDQVRMSDFFANAPANGAASAANDTAIRIVSDREPVLFSHVSLSSERSLDQTREGRPSYLEELQASACDGIESQKLNSEALVTEPRRTGVSDHRAYEPADSVFVALVTLLIGSIVWAASTLLSTNRTG